MNPGELAWRLAEARLREARVLLAAGEWSGAFYLGGYAIELALKGRMARHFGVMPDPRRVNDARTHDLRKLADHEWSDLRRMTSSGMATLYSLAGLWSEQDRYLEHTESETRNLLADVEKVFDELRSLP